MNYRSEIDGLRAIAVVPVILFHAGYEYFSGGYVGVDIFFVISGFLIATIIMNELNRESFSIVGFYERRARRILPALFFVVLVCIPFAWLWLPPGYMKEFSQSVVSVATFVSNFLFWLKSGYFDTSSELRLLLHTWSLAVEEQFYVLFPIFLMLVWKFGKRFVLASLCIIFLVSLGIAQYYVVDNPNSAFYLLPARMWELSIGVIAALYSLNKPITRGSHSDNVLSLLGLLAILYAIFLFDAASHVPGFIALIPTMGAVLIILFAKPGTWVHKLLSTRLAVGIGLISYSLYLWHQPVLALARHRLLGDISLVAPLLLLLVLVMSIFSWRFVEKPFRSRRFSRSQIFTFSGFGLVLLILFGGLGHWQKGFQGRTISYLSFVDDIQLGAYNYNNKELRTESWQLLRNLSREKISGSERTTLNNTNWFDLGDQRSKLLVVGNSHAKDMFNVFYNSREIQGMYQLGYFGGQIHKLNQTFYESPNLALSDVVVVASRYEAEDLNALDSLVGRLLQMNKNVVLVHRIFDFPYHEPYNLADQLIIRNASEQSSTEDLVALVNEAYTRVFQSGRSTQREFLAARDRIEAVVQKYPGVKQLDRMAYVCPEDVGCYGLSDIHEKYFFDYGHHTRAGAEFFGGMVDKIGLDVLVR